MGGVKKLFGPVVVLAAVLSPGVRAAEDGAACNPGDTAWMLVSTALVLLMTPGLAFFYGGLVRRKNVLSVLVQCFMCMCLMTILWVTVGYSLAFGSSMLGGLVGGFDHLFLTGPDINDKRTRTMGGNAEYMECKQFGLILFGQIKCNIRRIITGGRCGCRKKNLFKHVFHLLGRHHTTAACRCVFVLHVFCY